jgi:hypothetical protein
MARQERYWRPSYRAGGGEAVTSLCVKGAWALALRHDMSGPQRRTTVNTCRTQKAAVCLSRERILAPLPDAP